MKKNSKVKLNKFEKEIESSLEKGDWKESSIEKLKKLQSDALYSIAAKKKMLG